MRGERQRERRRGREGGGKEITMCLQTPTTRRREKGGRAAQKRFSLDLNILITVFFKSLPDAV